MKQLTIIFIIASTTQLSAMHFYKRLQSLENSAITRRCLLCKTQWFGWLISSNRKIIKECNLLEEKLEEIATTGRNGTIGDGYWAWIQAAAAYESHERVKQAVYTILEDESETIKEEERTKLSNIANQLADDYDLRQAAKKEQRLKILEQLKEEELKTVQLIAQMDNKEKKDTDLTDHTLKYPYMSNMFDGHVKQACLDCKPGIFIRSSTEKMCDTLEDRFNKTATEGHLEFGFLHTTTFEDKEKEHENIIKKMLPNLSDDLRYEELVKLNAYARRLQKNYHLQEDLKRTQQFEESMKRYKEEREKS